LKWLLQTKEGHLIFEGRGFSLGLEERKFKAMEIEVEIGIRPEDVIILPGESGLLQAKVDMVSNLGSERSL